MGAESRVSAGASAEALTALVAAGRSAAHLFALALEPIGLTPRQFSALRPLRGGCVTQQALGDSLEVDPAQLVGILNALEAEGLAVRRRDQSDRRRHIVEISAEGCARLRAADAALLALEEQLLSDLGPHERADLAALLQSVVARIGLAAPSDSEATGDSCDGPGT